VLNVQFSMDDLRSPESLERVLRQFQTALGSQPAAPQGPSAAEIAAKLAPLVRDELQATGSAPLNLQSLLPAIGIGVVLEDTHANRLTLYQPSNFAVGTLFWETDRTVLYLVKEVAGVKSWQYVSGMLTATFANRPTDLGTGDSDFLLFIKLYRHICRWNGVTWVISDGGGGYFVDSAIALGEGYQLCDGTATTYLAVSGADLAETAFTTPDENTAPAGVYHESIAAYSGTINAATAPGVSGSVANATATNQAATATNQNTVVTAHTVVERSDVAGTGIFVFDAAADADHATHTHVQDSHNHTQDAHTHAFGTLAVDATGEPRRMGVLRYFRR
jgi:hypothetical protein